MRAKKSGDQGNGEALLIPPLLTGYPALSDWLQIPTRTLRTLVQRKAIPHLRLGHRLIMFEPTKVLAALERFEVAEVGRRRCGKRREV